MEQECKKEKVVVMVMRRNLEKMDDEDGDNQKK
jgi:hypothetical protein